jgi:saccharopine dehydrogenase-like NADP-dependent oxidoreductase
MQILIVGGCGAQARPAIERLIAGDVFSHIVIGDINQKLAEQLLQDLDSTKLSASLVDAFDHAGMVRAMSEVDVVMNCSGPYHLLGVRVLKAAIEAGKHFVDYCDDVQPTLEMLSLSKQAQEKGVTAIIGLGVSPGYFNLLAREASDRLDSTDEINMYWSIAKGEPEGPAVIDHMLDIMSGEVLQFIDGKEVAVPALSGTEQEVEMPAPFGRMPAAFVGHPEPITLSRYIPGVKTVTNKYCAPMEEIGFFQELQELGLMRKEPITVRGQQVSPRDVLVTLLSSVPHEEAPQTAHQSAAILEVKGWIDGEPTTIRYELKGNMAPLTSLPAALGAELLARGEITETGVMPPEACIPPQAVLQPLANSGLVEIVETVNSAASKNVA